MLYSHTLSQTNCQIQRLCVWHTVGEKLNLGRKKIFMQNKETNFCTDWQRCRCKACHPSLTEVGQLTERRRGYFRVLLEIKAKDKSLEIWSSLFMYWASAVIPIFSVLYSSIAQLQHWSETQLQPSLWDRRCNGRIVGLELCWMNDTNKWQTHLVNPQLAHNNVVHCGGDLSPHIVVPARVKLQVNGTWGGNSDKRV